jgi:hypothetical protein
MSCRFDRFYGSKVRYAVRRRFGQQAAVQEVELDRLQLALHDNILDRADRAELRLETGDAESERYFRGIVSAAGGRTQGRPSHSARFYGCSSVSQ